MKSPPAETSVCEGITDVVTWSLESLKEGRSAWNPGSPKSTWPRAGPATRRIAVSTTRREEMPRVVVGDMCVRIRPPGGERFAAAPARRPGTKSVEPAERIRGAGDCPTGDRLKRRGAAGR